MHDGQDSDTSHSGVVATVVAVVGAVAVALVGSVVVGL